MADIRTGWLLDFEDNHFAPKTLFSRVLSDSDGTALDSFLTDLNSALRELITTEASSRESADTNIKNLKLYVDLADVNKNITLANAGSSGIGIDGILPTTNGGTGTNSLVANSLLLGGTSAVGNVTNPTTNYTHLLTYNNGVPVFAKTELAISNTTPEAQGPTITFKLGSSSVSSVTIPIATTGVAGAVSTSAQSFGGIKTFANTTDSSSTTSGAVVVSGGIGVAKNANIGGALNVAGAADFQSGIDMNNSAVENASGYSSNQSAWYFIDKNENTVAYIDSTGIHGANLYSGDTNINSFINDNEARLTVINERGLITDLSSTSSTTVGGSSNIGVTGVLPVASGGTGTGDALVAGGIIYGASTSAYGCTSAGTSGQVLMSGGSTGAPTWHTPASGNTVSTLVKRDNSGGFAVRYLAFQNSNQTPIIFRDTVNYLSVPSAGMVSLLFGTEDNTLTANKSSFYPGITDAFTLGTSDRKWSNVYATTFTGDLDGNATSATSAGKLSVSDTGSSTLPVYFENGVPKECSLGFADLLTSFERSGNTLSLTVGGTTKTTTAVDTPEIALSTAATEGPMLTVAVNGIRSSAITIPTASTTVSGVVTTGEQRFRGIKILEYPSISSNNTRYLGFHYRNSAGTIVGEHWYDTGDATNITQGQIRWKMLSPNSTANTSVTSYYEVYSLPTVAVGLTSNKTYSILTTKNLVTIGQGGTGAASAASARQNINYIGANPITSTTNDTYTMWSSLGSGIALFNTLECLTGQPSQYGILFNGSTGGTTNAQLWISTAGKAFVRCSTQANGFSDWQELLAANQGVATISGSQLTIASSSTDAASCRASNTNGTVSLLASTNRGLYDVTTEAWIVKLSTDGTTVTIPKWGTVGSSSKPVYFSSGQPAAITNLELSGTIKGTRLIASSSDSAVKHLEFSRAGYNYITTPAEGKIAFCLGGQELYANTSSAILSSTDIIINVPISSDVTIASSTASLIVKNTSSGLMSSLRSSTNYTGLYCDTIGKYLIYVDTDSNAILGPRVSASPLNLYNGQYLAYGTTTPPSTMDKYEGRVYFQILTS